MRALLAPTQAAGGAGGALNAPRRRARAETAAAAPALLAPPRDERFCCRRSVRCQSSAAPRSGDQRGAAPASQLPDVDWSRYHLQILIIDADDVLRGRMAAALLEKIAEWNGYGRVLLPFTCGVDADQGASAGGLATQAALMARARALGLRPRAFTRPTERFEAADLDRHDVVVAVDAATKAAVLRLVDPRYRDHYDQHVRLLSEYAASDAVLPAARVLRQGGLALLPRDMAAGLAARRPLAALRATRDVPRPDLTDASAAASARFDEMVALATLGCAGLAAHLIDSYPDDLPDYDPL